MDHQEILLVAARFDFHRHHLQGHPSSIIAEEEEPNTRKGRISRSIRFEDAPAMVDNMPNPRLRYSVLKSRLRKPHQPPYRGAFCATKS